MRHISTFVTLIALGTVSTCVAVGARRLIPLETSLIGNLRRRQRVAYPAPTPSTPSAPRVAPLPPSPRRLIERDMYLAPPVRLYALYSPEDLAAENRQRRMRRELDDAGRWSTDEDTLRRLLVGLANA